MKKLYIIPTYHCNLCCPHCDLHLKNDNFSSKFYSVLKNTNIDSGILFGGEPTLYKERFIKCLETNKVNSITTNLLNLDKDILNLYKKYNLSIATSWNPCRFNDKQYDIWINNLKLLQKNNLSCIILITLTEDLLTFNSFEKYLKDWDNIKSIDGILFEHLIDYNMKPDLHERADDWLCTITDKWCYSYKNLILDKIKNWNCDCSDVWTLNPNGELKKGCPQFEKNNFLYNCLQCKMANICQPCRLQHLCSFPKKLYKKVMNYE